MTRAVFAIGRILAGLGAVLVVAALAVFWLSLARAGDCTEPDCDDSAFQDAFEQAAVAVPVAMLVGAAGVALVHDTQRKLGGW